MEITYDLIKPLILEERIDKSSMICKFKIEGEVFENKVSIRVDSTDSTNRIKGMVRLNLISRMRSSLMRIIRTAVGGGVAGNTAAMVGNEVVRSKTSGTNYSQSDKERAVVDAFIRISYNFYYDEESKQWKIARKLSEFEKRLKANPLNTPYDKKTLARMMLEMAKADGSIAVEEKEFLQEFLDEDTGTFAELMRAPVLSRVELEEVSRDKKENVFMVAVAVALADKEFADKEREKLDEYADMLGLDDNRKSSLMKMAQDYTIENAIQMGGDMSRDEIYAYADSIGMDRAEAERAQIRFQKRQD